MIPTSIYETSFLVGDKVIHRKDPFRVGTIKIVEDNKLSCMVEWEDCIGEPYDFQWAEKLYKVER